MLTDAVQGATRPSATVIWGLDDNIVLDLTGATLSGRIRDLSTYGERDIAGALTVLDAPNGLFQWTYAPADVADAGKFRVQFTATYASASTVARSLAEQWQVHEAI